MDHKDESSVAVVVYISVGFSVINLLVIVYFVYFAMKGSV